MPPLTLNPDIAFTIPITALQGAKDNNWNWDVMQDPPLIPGLRLSPLMTTATLTKTIYPTITRLL